MNRFVVTVFRSEKKAYQGIPALRELHATGGVTLYGTAVVLRDAKGSLTIRQRSDQGPLGLGVDALVSGLIGLFGGPMGAAAGMVDGDLVGGWHDLVHAEVDDEFLGTLELELAPGKFALVAEVSEEWITPIDTRMEALGGKVVRTWRPGFVDDLIAKRVDALKAEVAQWKVERAAGKAELTVSRLEQQIDDAQKKLQSTAEKTQERLEHTVEELSAKLKALEEQATRARPEIKHQLEKRMAEVRKDFGERQKRLAHAYELMREALHP